MKPTDLGQLQHILAAQIDMPNVYMSGPSTNSLHKAANAISVAVNLGFQLVKPTEGMCFVGGKWQQLQVVKNELPACHVEITGLYGARTRCTKPAGHGSEHLQTDGIHRASDWPPLYRLIPQEEER